MRMSSIGVWSPAIGKDKESGPSYQGLGSAALFNIVQQWCSVLNCSTLSFSAGTLLVLCTTSSEELSQKIPQCQDPSAHICSH